MTMKLSQLLQEVPCETPQSLPDGEVVFVTEDSRRVIPGTLFVAARGVRTDGHDFAGEAVARGAVGILGDRVGLEVLHGVPYIRVQHPRRAGAILAHALAGHPARSMKVIGVTGTNGKSSSVIMAHHVLNACGRPAACLGTLGYRVGAENLRAAHTTPFGEDLAELFRRARETGQTHVVMEVSSHALDQERTAGIPFSVAAFTNFSQDHLDYHGNMDSYLRAKLRLFECVEGSDAFTVVNRDDPHAQAFLEASKVPCITYGSKGECRASGVRIQRNGTSFKSATPWGTANLKMRLLGRHNVSNALCVIAICGGLELPLEGIAEAIATLPSVPGRFEHVDAGQDFQVVVDYAHTEDGLRNVLEVAREICKGRVILAFGCGGDRDRTKRPKMGEVAAALADFSILTSDNPRTEDPECILLDIEIGVQRAGKTKHDEYEVITDRADAIRWAIGLARPGDLVMVAGKGHEDYQIFGTRRVHFDDREVVRAVLGERGYG
jgi:UDP-N-acetylmuramoyl-L-alanyl-D-glutamate--2,6-diaminopimelate ligase